MRRSAYLLAVGALLMSSLSAAPAAQAGLPPAGAAEYKWLRADCNYDSFKDRFVAVGRARTHVKSVPNNAKTYYQKVNIRIDKAVQGGAWRRLEGRTYSWSKFTHDDLPTFSTSGVKSVVGPTIANNGVLRVKINAKLRQVRRGPDKTVWTYKVATDPFECQTGGVGN